MKLNLKLLDNAFSKGPVVIFIGQSGCGKNTQSEKIKLISKELNPEREVYISETGQIWRDVIPKMTPFNKDILEKIQSEGRLQSYITTSILWGSKFLLEYNGGLIILDGSPRSIGEAQTVIDFYNGFANKEIIVFYIEISDEESDKRMIRRNQNLIDKKEEPRSDTDTPEKRRRKIAYFHTDVKPALNYLKDRPGVTMYKINGMQLEKAVSHDVMSLLSKHS